MATIKGYTDLEQSKKLAEILPLESADNYYSWHDELYYVVNKDCPYPYSLKEKIPCWSLAALLGVLPDTITSNDGIAFKLNIKKNIIEYSNPSLYLIYKSVKSDNLIDACYEMLLKLKENNII